jgi:hypothetical protein
MDTFTKLIQEWQVFYATVAAACATLTGLLFVALSMNVDILSREENTELMLVARQTFAEFLLVLMVALIFLVPRLGPLGLGVALLSLGGAWTFSLGKSFWETALQRKVRPDVGYFLRGFGLSLAGCLGVVAVALVVLLGYTEALYGLVFMLAALLASASRNAWFLLVQVRGRASKDVQRR